MHPIVYFYPDDHQRHAMAGHPEQPERVEIIRAALGHAGWWEPHPKLTAMELPEAVLGAVHRQSHLERLATAVSSGRSMDGDTYFTPDSLELARRSAGGAVSVASAVWQRQAKRGFALTRPPGHHATPNQPMGFCLLNNIALAAEYLCQQEGAGRLAIVDLDVHHGNGTQDIFYQRADVLFISVHQWPLYPGTGRLADTGRGAGLGTNLNLPLPPISGDRAYRTAMDEVILPVLERFGPQMLLVSAGFDTHWRDPLAHILVSAGTYGELVAGLVAFADRHCEGRIALCLEGGYDLSAAAACASAATAALLGEIYEDPLGAGPWEETDDWQRVIVNARSILEL